MLRVKTTKLLSLLLLIVAANPANAQTALGQQNPEANHRSTFVVGKVSSNFKKHSRMLSPMAEYLAQNMSDLGIHSGAVLLAKNNQEMVSYLNQGKIDLVTDTPFSAMLYTLEAPAEAIVRKWKKGVPTYYSIIFARKDSAIHQVSDLLGKTLVFEDPGSTSAYMLPLATLLSKGYKLVEKKSDNFTLPDDMIGFMFSGAEKRTSQLVTRGVADAGAISNLDWDKPDHIPSAHKRDYRIIHRSTAIPRAIEVIRSDLDPLIKDRVKALLLNAHNDPDAAHALKRYQKTKRFDELDEETLLRLEEIKKFALLFSTKN